MLIDYLQQAQALFGKNGIINTSQDSAKLLLAFPENERFGLLVTNLSITEKLLANQDIGVKHLADIYCKLNEDDKEKFVTDYLGKLNLSPEKLLALIEKIFASLTNCKDKKSFH